MLIAGLDLSMSETGIALVNTNVGAKLYRVRTPAPKLPKGQQPTLKARCARLQVIESRIGQILGCRPRDGDPWSGFGRKPDLLFVEAPAYSNSPYAHDISGNWHRVVGMLHLYDIPVVEISNTKLKKYATGSGSNRGATKVEKHHIISAVKSNYGQTVARQVDGEGDDVADAFILAAMACRLAGQPIEAITLPQTHLRALENVHLPEGFTK